MKKVLLGLLLSLSLLACSGSEEEKGPTCEEDEFTCEAWAWRTSGDNIIAYFRAKDCSQNFGACIAKRHGDCVDECYLAWIPSECEWKCQTTDTSTTSML